VVTGHFTPRKRAHWIGGWVGPRAVLDAVVKRKIPSLRRESRKKLEIIKNIAVVAATLKTQLTLLTVACGEILLAVSLVYLQYYTHTYPYI
jgi:hypothetical protein